MPAIERSPNLTREVLLRLAILCRIDRRQEELSVIPDTPDQQFVDDLVNKMNQEGLLHDPDGDGIGLSLTDKGRRVMSQAVSMFDRTRQFQIFARVKFVDLEEGTVNDEGELFDDLLDPRFGMPDEPVSDNTIDLRLAMIAFQADDHPDGPQEYDPWVIVFLQNMFNGDFERPDFWQNLRVGRSWEQIRDAVRTAKTWQSMADDEDTAREVMRNLYKWGMKELQKREGEVCSCGAYLAIFAADPECNIDGRKINVGGRLTHCPVCEKEFGDPPDQNIIGNCPRCQADIRRGQRVCTCGAQIDASLPPGTIQQEPDRVTEHTVTTYDTAPAVWGHPYGYYGYTPIGYYDPWGYPADLFMTALIIDAILD